MVVQHLGLVAFHSRAKSSILGKGTKIPQAALCGQKININ